MCKKLSVLVLGLLLPIHLASADPLQYTPRNPSFGGNPFNGPYLLSNATAQRQFNAPEKKPPSAVDQFSDSIQRSLLSQLSRNISDAILGENAKDSGRFTVGDTTVDFQRTGSDVVINVADPITGDKTTIKLPVASLSTAP